MVLIIPHNRKYKKYRSESPPKRYLHSWKLLQNTIFSCSRCLFYKAFAHIFKSLTSSKMRLFWRSTTFCSKSIVEAHMYTCTTTLKIAIQISNKPKIFINIWRMLFIIFITHYYFRIFRDRKQVALSRVVTFYSLGIKKEEYMSLIGAFSHNWNTCLVYRIKSLVFLESI